MRNTLPYLWEKLLEKRIAKIVKDDVHSVLRISSAHNKAGSPDIKIV